MVNRRSIDRFGGIKQGVMTIISWLHQPTLADHFAQMIQSRFCVTGVNPITQEVKKLPQKV